MRFAHSVPVFRPSFEPTVYLLLAVAAAFFAFIVVTNPKAVAIPLGGSLATVGLVWSIDRMYDHSTHLDERR